MSTIIEKTTWIISGIIFLVVLSGCVAAPADINEPTISLAVSGEETLHTHQEEEMSPSSADADVVFVRAEKETDPDTWTFYVTVQHPDTGWEDYADGWDVVLPDGTVVKPDPESPFTRLLLHPHEQEQPFTRSQRGIEIPAGIHSIRVRAHDLVDGFGGKEITVNLSAESGPGFEVVP